MSHLEINISGDNELVDWCLSNGFSDMKKARKKHLVWFELKNPAGGGTDPTT